MFEHLDIIPPDPLLGLIAAHRNDPRPDKIDLGVGVFKDDHGHTRLLDCVKQAEARLYEIEDTKTYLGPPGVTGFNQAITTLLYGADNQAVADGRVMTVQTPGGTGGLRVAGDFIKRAKPDATLWMTDPTWANHNALFPAAGIEIRHFPYYRAEDSSLDFDGMMSTLQQVGAGDVVMLHGCCHNPSGIDLSPDQWREFVALAAKNGFTPMVDIAYQGFGNGLDEDALGVRLLADTVPEAIIVSSCSKNFALYRERCGAISLVCSSAESARAAETHIHNLTRVLYSMPPSHGPAMVDLILHDEGLTARWHEELAEMRDRINSLRKLVSDKAAAAGLPRDFGFIEKQRGMFSFLGISREQVKTMADDYGIYMAGSSRINVAGFNSDNVDYFIDALGRVLTLTGAD